MVKTWGTDDALEANRKCVPRCKPGTWIRRGSGADGWRFPAT